MKLSMASSRACIALVILTLISANLTSATEIGKDLGWIFNYFDEPSANSSILVKDETIDARVSNIIYVVNSIGNDVGFPNTYLNERIEELAAGKKFVDEQRCQQELEAMISAVGDLDAFVRNMRQNKPTRKLNESDIRLAQVLDSFGRFGAGSLHGQTKHFGSISQCQESQLLLNLNSQPTRIQMRYCAAKMKADKNLLPALKELGLLDYQTDTMIASGICIPRSCHSKSFHPNQKTFEHLVHSQFQLPESIFVDNYLQLYSIYCAFEEDSELIQLQWSGKTWIVLVMFWLAFTLAVTIFKRNTQHKWLKALNLRDSLREFVGAAYEQQVVATEEEQPRVNLNGMDWFKVWILMGVCLNHAMLSSLPASSNPIKAVSFMQNDEWTLVIGFAYCCIDSLFIITGILLSYITIKRLRQSKWKWSWASFATATFKVSLYRYLRFIPVYFMAIWFKRSVLPSLGNSIAWDYGYESRSLVYHCRKQNWFQLLTPLGLYQPLYHICLPQTWSILNDVAQVWILAPVVVLMAKRPKLGSAVAVLTALASLYSGIATLYKIDESALNSLLQFKLHHFMYFMHNHGEVYTNPQNRIYAMSLGIIGGCILYHYDSNRKSWPWWFKGPVSIASVVIFVFQVSSPALIPLLRQQSQEPQEIGKLVFSLRDCVSRLIWCLANVVIFLRLTTDWKLSYRNSLSQFLRTLTRLNYLMLIVHVDLYLIYFHFQTSVTYYSWLQVWTMFSSVYLTSLLLCSLVHLTFENPMNKLVKLFMQKIDGPKQQKKTINSSEAVVLPL